MDGVVREVNVRVLGKGLELLRRMVAGLRSVLRNRRLEIKAKNCLYE